MKRSPLRVTQLELPKCVIYDSKDEIRILLMG
jgi:hypothetical protein